MSLILTNRITDKQKDWLIRLEYYGSMSLTTDEAEQLITELIEQERITMTKDQRDFINKLSEHDPDYLRRYRNILKGEI